MLIRDAMSRLPTIVSPHLSCEEALHISYDGNTHFMLVVDGDQLLGVARQCDLRRSRPEQTVKYSLRVPVVTIWEREPVSLVQRMLTQTSGGCVIVVDRLGVLTGIITLEDLYRSRALKLSRAAQRCDSCGTQQHLIFGERDEPAFCCACVDRARARAQITLA